MGNDEKYSEEEIAEAGRAEGLINTIIERCEDAGIEYDDFSGREVFGVTEIDLYRIRGWT